MKRDNKHLIHVDTNWIDKKIDGRGGFYGHNGEGSLAIIYGICGKNFLQVFGYNIILRFKYLKRKLRFK